MVVNSHITNSHQIHMTQPLLIWVLYIQTVAIFTIVDKPKGSLYFYRSKQCEISDSRAKTPSFAEDHDPLHTLCFPINKLLAKHHRIAFYLKALSKSSEPCKPPRALHSMRMSLPKEINTCSAFSNPMRDTFHNIRHYLLSLLLCLPTPFQGKRTN
uniref:Uncharacterized protein n=1 Tax=Varanus komodoensis TaxID=61221 RepID=A0A8D2LUG4_VARKO